MEICVVTGASENHKKSMRQFLQSFDCLHYKVYVWDLGLLPETRQEFLDEFGDSIQLRTFEYSKYPEWFAMEKEAGQYAWKPTLLLETMKEVLSSCDVLLWCDAGNKCKGGNTNIDEIAKWVRKHKLYSPTSTGTIKKWTHPKTFEFFQIPENSLFIKRYENRSGGLLAFFIRDPEIQSFLQTYAKCSSIKECIAPEGSNRSNHRQDQSVFTILFYRFFEKHRQYKFCNLDGIQFHCDCD